MYVNLINDIFVINCYSVERIRKLKHASSLVLFSFYIITYIWSIPIFNPIFFNIIYFFNF